MNGRIVVSAILAIAALAGAAMYILQVYAFYEDASTVQGGEVMLTGIASGQPQPILAEGLDAIDSESSPIRYRGCFTTPMSMALLTETYALYEERPEPRIAPDWFSCFDAEAIAEAIEAEEMIVFLGQENIRYGIDRVVAIGFDGTGRIWHEINACGEAHFDGDPVPEGCPPPPEN